MNKQTDEMKNEFTYLKERRNIKTESFWEKRERDKYRKKENKQTVSPYIPEILKDRQKETQTRERL